MMGVERWAVSQPKAKLRGLATSMRLSEASDVRFAPSAYCRRRTARSEAIVGIYTLAPSSSPKGVPVAGACKPHLAGEDSVGACRLALAAR